MTGYPDLKSIRERTKINVTVEVTPQQRAKIAQRITARAGAGEYYTVIANREPPEVRARWALLLIRELREAGYGAKLTAAGQNVRISWETESLR